MIDLHTHTLLSDGVLLPSELVRRAEVLGYRVIGITDHVDRSNIDFVLAGVLKVCKDLSKKSKLKILPGIELTHIFPKDFEDLVKYARKNGACLVVGHGETVVEPVRPGTNRAAIEAGVDILAHPGLITKKDAQLAAKKTVMLEISARSGHCLANGHVVKMALQTQAGLVLNTDAHTPDNLINQLKANLIAEAAGLNRDQIRRILIKKTENFVKQLTKG